MNTCDCPTPALCQTMKRCIMYAKTTEEVEICIECGAIGPTDEGDGYCHECLLYALGKVSAH